MFLKKDRVINKLLDDIENLEYENEVLDKQNYILLNTIGIISSILSSNTTPNEQKVLEISNVIYENLSNEEELFEMDIQDEEEENPR